MDARRHPGHRHRSELLERHTIETHQAGLGSQNQLSVLHGGGAAVRDLLDDLTGDE